MTTKASSQKIIRVYTMMISRYSTHRSAVCSCGGFVSVDQRRLGKNIDRHTREHRSKNETVVVKTGRKAKTIK